MSSKIKTPHQPTPPTPEKTMIPLGSGSLNATQLSALLNGLPMDLTFIDDQDIVRYFTKNKNPIFERPDSILGQHVNLCHSPTSIPLIAAMLESFKNGTQDHEDMWIKIKDMFVYIRYLAIRGPENHYLGTLEVVQDIRPIRSLEGEKKTLSK